MRFSTFTTARVDLPLPHASLSKEADKQGSDRGSRRCCHQTSTAGALLCIHVDFRTSSRNPGNCQEDYSRYCYLCHSSRAAGRERPGRHRGTSGRRGPSATGLTLWEEHMRCAVMVMISESCRWLEGFGSSTTSLAGQCIVLCSKESLLLQWCGAVHSSRSFGNVRDRAVRWCSGWIIHSRA